MKYRHLIKSMEAGVISVSGGIKNKHYFLCTASKIILIKIILIASIISVF